jgi:hypothetical protein
VYIYSSRGFHLGTSDLFISCLITRKGGMRVNMLDVYENRRIKPIEIVLRKRGGEKR